MDIYLVRHTKTDTEKGLCYGQSDVPLAESFIDEARQLQGKLPELSRHCKVFSSPLTRCLQLAERFSETVTTDRRLLEVNFGGWENSLFDDIDADALRHWTENFVHQAPPNGESFTDLCERAGSFWQDLLRIETAQVLIITHAGVIRALLAHILQLPPANAFQFRIDSGSVHKLQRHGDYTYIHYLNR
jgi:alpha-ribazole phosphatase